MRTLTGFFVILMFIVLFSYAVIGVTNEVSRVQTIDQILEEKIKIDEITMTSNSYIYDSNRETISEVYQGENRIYLPFSEIPKYFIEAMIATEDRHFFSHKGFDMAGITRAFLANAKTEKIEQGGSTITQQLVKNLFLNNERTFNRKLTELLYAYQFEKLFSKQDILELYLNTVYFHNGVYGIEAASQFYFSRPVSQLTLAEIAFLSAIPNNPSRYDPIKSIENTNERKHWILTKMLEMGFVDKLQFSTAASELVQLNVSKKIDNYSDYVTYIHYEFEQLIGEVEGFNHKIASATTEAERANYLQMRQKKTDEILKSGVHIYTALQPDKQKQIYQTIEKHLPETEIQAVATVIDRDHRIVAISGGKGFQKFDFHRGFQAFRQPGSAIKPLLVFVPYLEETNTKPTSKVSAAPFCRAGYCPQNFGGAIYNTVSIETAIKHSYNTAAVRMLEQISIVKAFSYFEQLSFSKIVHEDYRLPAALGGLTYGVSPLEITSAYSTFANEGKYQPARAITKVTDSNGNVLYQWHDAEKQLWSTQTNTMMRTLLNKVINEGTGRKAAFNSRALIGGKTGTTNDFNDLWFIGFNEKYTTGVWVGHDQPHSLEALSSRSPHLLIWKDLMKK